MHKPALILMGFTPDLVFQILTKLQYIHMCPHTQKIANTLIFLVFLTELIMLFKSRMKHGKPFVELRKSVPILTQINWCNMTVTVEMFFPIKQEYNLCQLNNWPGASKKQVYIRGNVMSRTFSFN